MYSNVPSGLMTTVAPALVVTVTGPVAASPVTGSTIVNVSFGLLSLSLTNTFPLSGSLASVTKLSSLASGAESSIAMVKVAESMSVPSVSVYGTLTVPTNSGSGVNVISPVVGFTTSVPAGSPFSLKIVMGPAVGSCPPTSLMVIGSWFGSVSLSSKLPVNGPSPTGPAIRSSPADGGEFSFGLEFTSTDRVTVAVSVAPLGSDTVYSNVGSPWNVGSVGVKTNVPLGLIVNSPTFAVGSAGS